MALPVGATAPDFTLVSDAGELVSLSDFRGRKLVLIFFPFAFSGVCTKEFHDVKKAAERLQAEGAEVLGISVDHKYSLRAWKAQEGYTATFLADFQPRGAVAQAYDAYLEQGGFATRTTYVIDGDGKIAHVIDQQINEKPDPEEYLLALSACPV
jgi:peroxiredoxin